MSLEESLTARTFQISNNNIFPQLFSKIDVFLKVLGLFLSLQVKNIKGCLLYSLISIAQVSTEAGVLETMVSDYCRPVTWN